MGNLPVELGPEPAFRDNDFPYQIEFESPALIVAPVTVEVWSKNAFYQTITSTVSGATIEFEVPKEVLGAIDFRKSQIRIKYGEVVMYSVALTVTMDGDISQPRVKTVRAPAAGIIRITMYSDLAAVVLAKQYRDETEVMRDEVATNTQTMEALLGQAYASMGITGVKTRAQIRAGSGNQGLILRVSDLADGKLAYYEPNDTTSADDGSTVLVTSDNKRYMIIDFYSIIRSPFA